MLLSKESPPECFTRPSGTSSHSLNWWHNRSKGIQSYYSLLLSPARRKMNETTVQHRGYGNLVIQSITGLVHCFPTQQDNQNTPNYFSMILMRLCDGGCIRMTVSIWVSYIPYNASWSITTNTVIYSYTPFKFWIILLCLTSVFGFLQICQLIFAGIMHHSLTKLLS